MILKNILNLYLKNLEIIINTVLCDFLGYAYFLTQEGQNAQYVCEKCLKTYNIKSSLQRHMRLECGKPPQFWCPYCNFGSKRKDNLRVHIIGVHKVNLRSSELQSFKKDY